MGAPRLQLRTLTTEEEKTLRTKLADKRLPAKIYERYRLLAVVAGGLTAASSSLAEDSRSQVSIFAP